MNSRVAPAPEGHDALDFELPKPKKIRKRKLVVIALVIAGVFAIAFFVSWLPRHNARTALVSDAERRSADVPRITVVLPKEASSDQPVLYSGAIEALEETVIYPRVDGYVRSWLVDLGGHVEAGDLLAEIDTPELDQLLAVAQAELVEARAQSVQARATRNYSKSTADRAGQLNHEGLTSQQDLEQRQAAAASDQAGLGVAAANVASKEATVKRLVEQKAFSRVVAPYAGMIISRTLTRGSLVSAGPSTPLFKIAATDPVRVMVSVPQDVAPSVRSGMPAKLIVREYGAEEFAGEIARASGALDASTRTMLVEVRVPNPDGRLLTGMSVKVSLTLPLPHRLFEVPGTAVVTDARGVRVAVIDQESTVRFKPVVIERDLGSTILVSAGLDGSERIVENASSALVDGSQVEAVDGAPPGSEPPVSGS